MLFVLNGQHDLTKEDTFHILPASFCLSKSTVFDMNMVRAVKVLSFSSHWTTGKFLALFLIFKAVIISSMYFCEVSNTSLLRNIQLNFTNKDGDMFFVHF